MQKIYISGNHSFIKRFTPGSWLQEKEISRTKVGNQVYTLSSSIATMRINQALGIGKQPNRLHPLDEMKAKIQPVENGFRVKSARALGKDILTVKVHTGFDPEKPYVVEFGKGVSQALQNKLNVELPRSQEHFASVAQAKAQEVAQKLAQIQQKHLEQQKARGEELGKNSALEVTKEAVKVLTPKVNNLPNRKPRVAQRQQGQGIGNI
jgi:hypothetical protein